MTLPFDGAVSAYLASGAPDDLRAALENAHKDAILNDSYPYREEMKRKDYERDMARPSSSRGATRPARAARSSASPPT